MDEEKKTISTVDEQDRQRTEGLSDCSLPAFLMSSLLSFPFIRSGTMPGPRQNTATCAVRRERDRGLLLLVATVAAGSRDGANWQFALAWRDLFCTLFSSGLMI